MLQYTAGPTSADNTVRGQCFLAKLQHRQYIVRRPTSLVIFV